MEAGDRQHMADAGTAEGGAQFARHCCLRPDDQRAQDRGLGFGQCFAEECPDRATPTRQPIIAAGVARIFQVGVAVDEAGDVHAPPRPVSLGVELAGISKVPRSPQRDPAAQPIARAPCMLRVSHGQQQRPVYAVPATAIVQLGGRKPETHPRAAGLRIRGHDALQPERHMQRGRRQVIGSEVRMVDARRRHQAPRARQQREGNPPPSRIGDDQEQHRGRSGGGRQECGDGVASEHIAGPQAQGDDDEHWDAAEARASRADRTRLYRIGAGHGKPSIKSTLRLSS